MAHRPPALCLTLPSFGPFLGDDLAAVVDLAEEAERAGVDAVVVVDHVVMGANTDAYAWGPFPYPDPETPWMEPLTTLAAIAARTDRLRLTTGILVAGLRRAPVLAKTLATLDRLSRGRLDIGVGVGWQAEEFAACGLDFGERGPLLTDTIAACRELWRSAPAAYVGSTLTVEDVWCSPRPTRPDGVPVLFSGTLNRRNVARITSLGDGWIPIMGETLAGVRAGAGVLTAAWEAVDRDPAGLRVRVPLPVRRADGGGPDLAATLAGVDEVVAHGATEVVVGLQPFARTLDEAPAVLAELGERWAQLGAVTT